MKEISSETGQYLADTVMGRPYGFSVGGEHLSLYPVTLGKIYVLQRQIEQLGIDTELLRRDVSIEALRLAKEKNDTCLRIIYYHTCKTAEEVFDCVLMAERLNLFRRELSYDDIAALMIVVLTSDKTSDYMTHLGIDKEQERMKAVMRVKSKGNKNSLTFGGNSVYGTLIDAACERYGWTKEYVVWGIDYSSLRLMLADKVTSLYVTDEEWKKLPAYVRNTNDIEKVNGDDASAVKEAIKSEKWD